MYLNKLLQLILETSVFGVDIDYSAVIEKEKQTLILNPHIPLF